jgi:uncharacterized protein YdhG (YjbR/CyaY superfamily)
MADKKTTKPAPERGTSSQAWTKEELAAIKEHNREVKAAAKSGADADGEREVLAKIAEMPEPDRGMAERIHALVKASAPSLTSRTYYGMPAYARDGKVVCFFQPAAKFKARYATFGFNDTAKLDDGAMWPTSWALTTLTAADEATLGALVKKAAS